MQRDNIRKAFADRMVRQTEEYFQSLHRNIRFILVLLIILSCRQKKNQGEIQSELKSIDLIRGNIALCGSENGEFGTVNFPVSCTGNARANFNLATALLHSFEYSEAEKVFAKVIDEDPECLMAYWGVAMCNFHPLWSPPGKEDLKKGSSVIALARSLDSKSTRESDYLEAIATIYDQWDKLDYQTRALKFEKASEEIYKKYPEDKEAAIFYALALRATAEPTDKSFRNQRKAGEILDTVFTKEPNHPGIAHYIIHTYDYPELAELALPAARKYASIAAASAHAQHMPSHIFTRLGLWDESIRSNINSISAARCYAENLGLKSHWDEELHGMDYLVYAYLQQARDKQVLEKLEYLRAITDVFPLNFKDAYSFAAIPVRYALERKDWKSAAGLELRPANFPWHKFPWEKANIHFGRLLGAVHTHQPEVAQQELKQLNSIHAQLQQAREDYKAGLVLIQIKTSEGWMEFEKGHRQAALQHMMDAAAMEDATEKHPVTPGEVIPARELLGDMYMEMKEPVKALEAYESDLKRHPNRFNGLYGAGLAEEKSGNVSKATAYYKQLLAVSDSSVSKRPQREAAESFVRNNK
jgi:tetratricopeptide (TPR) repeat protein